jgi:threonine/homoserine efflux transporter RhtA
MDLKRLFGNCGRMGKRTVPAPALVLCSVVSIQFGQALGKTLFESVGPSGTVALRLGTAAVLLLLLYGPRWPRSWADRAVILGFGSAIAGMNLIYPALQHLPVSLATSLQLSGPIILALTSSRRWADVVFVVLAGAGVSLFHNSPAGGYSIVGVVLALCSGACMAMYLLLSRKAGTRSAGGGVLALAVAWAAVLTVPVGAINHGTDLLTPRVLAIGAGVAVLSAVVPYSLELAALRRMPPRAVGVLQSLEPVTAGVAGTVVLEENLRVVQWIALGFVSAAGIGTVARLGHGPNRVDETARIPVTDSRSPLPRPESFRRRPSSGRRP